MSSLEAGLPSASASARAASTSKSTGRGKCHATMSKQAQRVCEAWESEGRRWEMRHGQVSAGQVRQSSLQCRREDSTLAPSPIFLFITPQGPLQARQSLQTPSVSILFSFCLTAHQPTTPTHLPPDSTTGPYSNLSRFRPISSPSPLITISSPRLSFLASTPYAPPLMSNPPSPSSALPDHDMTRSKRRDRPHALDFSDSQISSGAD